MAAVVLSGERFSGVCYGTAPGTDPGHVIGFTPLNSEPLLRVHETDHPALLYCAKYYHHEAGDPRGGDRPAENRFALTMLISQGCWRQRVWGDSPARSVEVLLAEPGDFIAWGPGLRHSWYPVQASTMLTIKWSCPAELGAAPNPGDR